MSHNYQLIISYRPGTRRDPPVSDGLHPGLNIKNNESNNNFQLSEGIEKVA